MNRGKDSQQTSGGSQRDVVRKLPNRDRPSYAQNISFPGMDVCTSLLNCGLIFCTLRHVNFKPMKTDFSSIVQEFERLKVVWGFRQQQYEQATELPHASARTLSQVSTLQTQALSHPEQSFGRRYVGHAADYDAQQPLMR